MRFTFPVEKVHLPNVERIQTISEARDYGAKVCLHMSQMTMKFPPSPELDAKFADSVYSHFRTVVPPYTDNEIAKFESFHRHIIQARISASKNEAKVRQKVMEREELEDSRIKQQPDYDTLSFETEEEHIHTPLPQDSGRITRSSLAFLYAAIVCTVISHQTHDEHTLFEPPSEEERTVAKAICTEFQLHYVDERMRKHWKDWLQIALDCLPSEIGIAAARAKHATTLDNGKIVKLSRKQIQKKIPEMQLLAPQIKEYLPLFQELFKRYGRLVKSHPQRVAAFVFEFLQVQLTIYDQTRTYRYASVIHGKNDKCQVSPYEQLKEVRNEREQE